MLNLGSAAQGYLTEQWIGRESLSNEIRLLSFDNLKCENVYGLEEKRT
jgi:hypothetical protein